MDPFDIIEPTEDAPMKWGLVEKLALQIEDDPGPVRKGREAMLLPLAAFWDWHWVMQCEGTCETQRKPLAPLVLRLPAEVTVGEVVRRMVCQCGHRPDILAMQRRNSLGHRSDYMTLVISEGSKWRER